MIRYLVPILLIATITSAQVPYDRNEGADVQRYVFGLTLNDSTNVIYGETDVTVTFTGAPAEFRLDLIGKSGTFGMEVLSVSENSEKVDFDYHSDKLFLKTGEATGKHTYHVTYTGIAEKGLVIDTTKFGNRSFFGDNWPTLARHWLPSVDHPYDKAAVEFRIIAPAHYDVVATGKKVEESYLNENYKLTRYVEPAPVAMKVVTIGVCEFATRVLGKIDSTEITAWVYPENRLEGFSDYAVAVKVMDYFIGTIGPYSYAKLANMQAKTQWGGLENAGTIAYRESSVTGKNEVEGLIAHEIAHQWFGNSVTEDSWNHVWLSEGFATYFTILYLESVYGDERRIQELKKDRGEIINYYRRNPSSVVDNSINEAMKVLSTNTYQKGGWVLNMLRHRIGDDAFRAGIRTYYATYRNGNALTEDFRKVMEEASGQDLEQFFQQWIYTPGYPELEWSWQYSGNTLKVHIDQVQDQHVFSFPLDLGIISGDAGKIETIMISEKSSDFEIKLGRKPENVTLDPGVWLLFEEK